MEDLIIKIREYMSDLNNRKLINKLLLILVVMIVFLIIINGFSSNNKKDSPQTINDVTKGLKDENTIDYSLVLENKLIDILKVLKGVGDVNVMVTLEDSSEKVPATNITKSLETTDEIDSEGGTRKTSREEENLQLLQLDDDIVILKETKANVKGVIVVAEGAESSEVLEQIYEAVKTVLGISGNKVQVFPRK